MTILRFYAGVIVCAAGFVALVAATTAVLHHIEERPIRQFRDVLDALEDAVALEVSGTRNPQPRCPGTSCGAAPPRRVRRAVDGRAVPSCNDTGPSL